jgi:O-antigen/teichoic acid export membrane protein
MAGANGLSNENIDGAGMEMSRAAVRLRESAPLPDQRGKGGVPILTVGNGIAVATRLLTSILVAQILGPAGRGAVALINVVDEASTALLTGGIPTAAGYHAKLGLDSDRALINAALRAGFLLLPLTVTAAMLVGVLGLASLEPTARWLTVLLIGWTGLVNLPGLTAANILQAHRELRHLAIYRSSFNSVTLVVVALCAVLGGLSVAWVAAAFVLGRIVTGVYGLTATAWPSMRPHARLKPLLRYGLRALPGSVGPLLNTRLDQLVIAPMVGFGDLGLYAVAAGTSFAPAVLPMSMAASAFAMVEKDADRGRQASAATAIRRGILASALAAAGLALVTPILIPLLYGSAFAGAIGPTMILLGGSVAWGGQLVASQCANALGQPSYSSISEVTGVLVTIVGLVIFVPLYGITGAAVVSLAAYVIRLAVTLLLLRREGVKHITPGFDDLAWLWRRGTQRLRLRSR